jgi:large subunit ribosomal protein L11
MLKSLIRLQVKAQSATSGPPLGPALGQFGVPTMDFCKRFNDISKEYEKGVLINTIVLVKMDRTYEIKLKGPQITFC